MGGIGARARWHGSPCQPASHHDSGRAWQADEVIHAGAPMQVLGVYILSRAAAGELAGPKLRAPHGGGQRVALAVVGAAAPLPARQPSRALRVQEEGGIEELGHRE